MDQDKQTGFFRQYYIACFQPRNYKTLLEKKTGHHVMYVFLLMVFLFLIDTIIPFGAWTASVGGFKNLFLNRLPEFTMENGTLHTEEPIDFTIGGIIRVQVDSSVEKFKESDFKVDYQEEILMSKTNLLMRVGKNVSEVSLNQLGGITVNNQTLVNAMPAIGAAMFMYFLFSLLSKTIQYLLMALAFGLICRAGVQSPEGKFVTIKQSFLIAIYAKTLFAIINSVNICLGYVLSSFWITMISVMTVTSYIYRAEISMLKPKAS